MDDLRLPYHTRKGRKKFGILSVKELRDERLFSVSEPAHDRLHGPSIVTFTSETTLVTTAGTKIRMPRGGEITRVQARTTGNASGASFELDLLIDGTSIFSASNYVTILTGTAVSGWTYPNVRARFNEDSDIKFQIVTIAAATGPYVATIEYLPGW